MNFVKESFLYLYQYLIGQANASASLFHYICSIGIIVIFLSLIFIIASIIGSKKKHIFDLDEKMKEREKKKK